jgi:hypothetical protein
MVNWGECFLSHYETHLGKYSSYSGHTLEGAAHAIQILGYDGVFKDCKTYCTLGFSHYSAEDYDERFEVVIAVDDGFEAIPKLLASALFYIADCHAVLSSGLSKGGLHELDPAFVERYGKDAFYFMSPFPFPTEFAEVTCGQERGLIYLCVPLSKQEHEYWKQHGAVKLEQLMEAANVDPFALGRPSAV